MQTRERPSGCSRASIQTNVVLCQNEIAGGFTTVSNAFDVEAHSLPIVKLLKPCSLKGGNVYKNVLRSMLWCDEADTLSGIEPFHGAIGDRDVS